jgi:hypothetical protein
MRWWLFLALPLFGCTAAPMPAEAPSAAPAEVAMPEIAPRAEALVAPRRAAPPNRCLPNGLPAASKHTEPSPGATCRDHAPIERRLRALLTKDFQRSRNGRVDVVFGCDPVGEVTELSLETGYGHGGSLTLWRLRRPENGSTFDVLGVASDGWITAATDAERATTVQVTRGVVTAQDLERALVTARPALTALVREVEPPPLPNSLGSYSMFHSSGNFHHFIRLQDDRNHALEASYTGYPHSDAQRLYVGLEVAHDAIVPLFENFEFEREAANQELREWFSAYVVRAWPRLEHSSAWWVRERLVILAAKAGEHTVVPMIVSQIERGLQEVAAAPAERAADMAERYLPEPLTALHQVTGWDPRISATGIPLSLSDAGREAIAECRHAY